MRAMHQSSLASAFARFQALDQRFAEIGFGLHRQQFQACGGTPHLTQQAGVDARRFLARLRQQRLRQALEDVGLLIAIQAARNAAPQDPPLNLRFDVVRETQTGRVDAPRLLDTEIIAGIAEARPQAEAAQIQPACFVARRLVRGRQRIRASSRRVAGSSAAATSCCPSASVCSSLLGSSSGADDAFGSERGLRSVRERSVIAVSLITAAGRGGLLRSAPPCVVRTEGASGVR